MCPDKIRSSSPPTRNSVIREARQWLDTPYQHQAMVRGAGVDCVGFIVGVGLASGVLHLSTNERKAYAGYGRLPNPKKMRFFMEEHLIEISEANAHTGDVVWIQWREGLPMHLALIGTHKGGKTLMHAVADAGKVVEHSLTPQWDERITSFWKYPGVSPWLQ